MGISEQPLILNLAPTGMVPTRAMNSIVPLQPDEVVKDVVAAAGIGISIVHVHARDAQDEPTYRKEIYARIIGGIREHCPDLIVCASCSGRLARSVDQRAEVLELEGDLKPDMASLTLSSMNFASQASVNSPETVKELARRMLDRGVRPEVEIFDLGMVNMLHYLRDRGLVTAPTYANLLFGNLATAQADFLEIGAVVSKLPAGTTWALAGLGASQLPVSAMAAAAAPGVRIGLEDNLWMDAGRTRPATNQQLVESVHALAEVVGRPIMTPAQLRKLLGLPVSLKR